MKRGGAFDGDERVERGVSLWPWLVVVLVLFALGAFLCRRTEEPPGVERESALVGEESVARTAVLYFGRGESGRLEPERRDLLIEDTSREAFARLLVEELAAGPLSGDAHPVLPPEAKVRSVFFDDLGGLFIDLEGTSLSRWTWDASSELMALHSMVKTLSASFPEVLRIGFLIDGSVTESFRGHVDTTHPFEVAEWS